MSAELLLRWMSARVQGSWAQFRGAVEELHLSESDDFDAATSDEQPEDRYSLPLYQALRLNLQRLGHAEFFAGAAGNDWRIAPPCLAVTKRDQEWVGVLAGARSNKLLERLSAEAARRRQLESRVLPACPDQIRFLADDLRVLRALADRTGLLFQHSAPTAMLSSIPCIDDAALRRPTDLPFGNEWRVERFSPTSLAWKDATVESANSARFGLFRFSRRYERLAFLRMSGATYRMPGQAGKYLVLRGRRLRILRYDPAGKCLSLPASCRPPFLLERALVLCSGTPPRYEARSSAAALLHYADVPGEIARLASALLRQELR